MHTSCCFLVWFPSEKGVPKHSKPGVRRALSAPVLLQAITEDKYEIIQSVGDAAIVIKNTKEPPLTLTIHLTSPVVREEMEKQLAGGRGDGNGQQALWKRCCR